MIVPLTTLLALLPTLTLALPSSYTLKSFPPQGASLVKRQMVGTTVPEACAYSCNGISTALETCENTTCLCNEDVLYSFLNCSECTLQQTNPSNLNLSIASSQASLDAYRQTCLTSSVPLPNVTVTPPSPNATYPTASPGSNSSAVLPSASSSALSASIASSSSSPPSMSSSMAASSTSAVAGASSAALPSSASNAAASASAAVASNTSGGGVEAALNKMAIMGGLLAGLVLV